MIGEKYTEGKRPSLSHITKYHKGFIKTDKDEEAEDFEDKKFKKKKTNSI